MQLCSDPKLLWVQGAEEVAIELQKALRLRLATEVALASLRRAKNKESLESQAAAEMSMKTPLSDRSYPYDDKVGITHAWLIVPSSAYWDCVMLEAA